MNSSPTTSQRGRIKCVVWDLDDTLWKGTLLEDGEVAVREELVGVIRELDSRGVLNSIASRNDRDAALGRLRTAGIADLFLYPQIGWNAKSSALLEIARSINIGVGSLAFVDDQPFELEEVAFALPEVLCLGVDEAAAAVRDRPDFHPRFVTDESRVRRRLYQADIRRDEVEREFAGTSEEFLATLDMEMTITRARPEDLRRAEELTVRTNQLNSTGRPYSYDELAELCSSRHHMLLVARLTDRFGSYGTIGLSLVETGDPHWYLRLLLMSCRVMSRGAGTVMLNHVMRLARSAGAGLRADFVDTGRNRLMHITYRFAGFREVHRNGKEAILECDVSGTPPPPPYVTLWT